MDTTTESVSVTHANALRHLSGLDGLRGVAVIGVLLFHGGFGWAKGGFLGVSTFFTLSGFLITNLLVREFDRTSSIALIRFWGRRFRRLLPAAILAIFFIGVVWWRIGTPTQLSSLRGDMLASLGYVANWRLYASGTSYANLFSAPTPLQHFWSLAIEEQFYVFFPLIVIVLMRIGGRKLLATVCTIAAIGSIALTILFRSNFDRIYYGTDTRVAELLFGVLLAIWWSGRQHKNDNSNKRQTPTIDLAGLIALAAVLIAWNQIPEASDNLAKGGLPLYAAATTLIIYATTRPGITTKLLSMTWLRWTGLISYGLYLYHWPIFLWLSSERTGLSLWPLFTLRITVTVTIAYLSWRFIEMPIRERTLFASPKKALTAAAIGAVFVAICAFAITLDPPTNTIPFASAKVGEDLTHVDKADPSSPRTTTPAQSVWIIGDSGMMDEQVALGAALKSAGTTSIIYGAGPGFGLAQNIPWRQMWASTLEQESPNLVIAMMGDWDLKFIAAKGTAAYDRILDEAVALLSSRGAHILWLPALGGGTSDTTAYNDAIRSLAERHPGVVLTAEVNWSLQDSKGSYPRSVTASDGTEKLLRKADIWHLCQDGASRLADAIMDELVKLDWSTKPIPGWENGEWRSANEYNDPVGACQLS